MGSPRWHFCTTITLAILVALGLATSVAFIWASADRAFDPTWQLLILVPLWTFGVGGAFYYVRDLEATTEHG
ncbi:MAG TPA: hypothetical protein QGF05_04440 [Dehalococcoidia bacterium]|nr:hypothetical protein [Dehalococcoidia bacterium]